jgi:hypothetical protein
MLQGPTVFGEASLLRHVSEPAKVRLSSYRTYTTCTCAPVAFLSVCLVCPALSVHNSSRSLQRGYLSCGFASRVLALHFACLLVIQRGYRSCTWLLLFSANGLYMMAYVCTLNYAKSSWMTVCNCISHGRSLETSLPTHNRRQKGKPTIVQLWLTKCVPRGQISNCTSTVSMLLRPTRAKGVFGCRVWKLALQDIDNLSVIMPDLYDNLMKGLKQGVRCLALQS